jgi:PAS domain-containing protein
VSSSPASSINIMALAHEELANSERAYRHSRQLQILTFIFSVTSIFTTLPYTYLFALGTLFVQVAAWRRRAHARSLQAVGDEGRMRGLLIDALGSTNEGLDLTNLLQRFSETARDRASRSANPDYFASSLPPSPQRLREHLQENAFWGKILYDMAAKRYRWAVYGLAACSVVVILVAIPLAPRQQALLIARIMVVALTFGAALTQASDIWSWRTASSRIENVDRRLAVLSNYSDDELKGDRLESLLAVFGDYCVSTGVPPIPRKVYQDNRRRLNDLWNERQGIITP